MSFIINPYSFGVAFDADYQAILNRGTALGYTLPSAAQQIKQNAFVLALKAASLWTPLDVLYVFATDGNSDFATLNWKAPSSFQASKVNSPTFTTNVGFNGNGSTSYVNTNWIPSTNGVNYTLNAASIGCYCNTDSQSNTGRLFGAINVAGNSAVDLIPRNTLNNSFGSINDFGPSTNMTNSNSIGLYHYKRTASNVNAIFKNGSSLGTGTANSVSLPDRTIFICGRNVGGSLNSPTDRQIGMFFAGASLSGLESSFYTAWNNYFTSL